MARSSVFQRIQLGVEVTPGTAVAANKRLQHTMFRPRPRTPKTPVRPSGFKMPTSAPAQKGWTEGDITGVPAYTDMAYLMAAFLKKQTGAPTTFKPDIAGPEPVTTYTVEHGASDQAEKFAYCFLTSLSLRFTPREAELRGSLMGQEMEEDVALTGSPTLVARAPIAPKSVDVYVGDTVGALAKLGKGLEVSVNISNIRQGQFTLDAADNSFSDTVELAYDFTAQLIVEHDSESVGFMDDLRTGVQKFLRIKSTGPEYGVGTPYDFQMTLPFEFGESDRNDQDGAWGSVYDLIPEYNDSFAGGIEVVLAHGLAGL